MGWEDGSVGKILPMNARRASSIPQNSHEMSRHEASHPVYPNQQAPGSVRDPISIKWEVTEEDT